VSGRGDLSAAAAVSLPRKQKQVGPPLLPVTARAAAPPLLPAAALYRVTTPFNGTYAQTPGTYTSRRGGAHHGQTSPGTRKARHSTPNSALPNLLTSPGWQKGSPVSARSWCSSTGKTTPTPASSAMWTPHAPWQATRVRFSSPMVSCRSVAPYEELYGSHPNSFNFDAFGRMVPPSPMGFGPSPPESPAAAAAPEALPEEENEDEAEDGEEAPAPPPVLKTPSFRPRPRSTEGAAPSVAPQAPTASSGAAGQKAAGLCMLPLRSRQICEGSFCVGSALHGTGECRPCEDYHKPQGCARGRDCPCCHMCAAGAAELYAARKTHGVKAEEAIVMEAVGAAVPALCEMPSGTAAGILASRPKPPPLEIV